jgi:hypothetical protein
MRITIEITDEQRARLMEIAGRRGEKGFSRIVQEAVDLYLERMDRSDEAVRDAIAAIGFRPFGGENDHFDPRSSPAVAVIVADSDVLIDALRGHEPFRQRNRDHFERIAGLILTAGQA